MRGLSSRGDDSGCLQGALLTIRRRGRVIEEKAALKRFSINAVAGCSRQLI